MHTGILNGCYSILNENLFGEVEVEDVSDSDNGYKSFYDSYDYVFCILLHWKNKNGNRTFNGNIYESLFDILDTSTGRKILNNATERIFGSTMAIDDYSCAIISPMLIEECVPSEEYLDNALNGKPNELDKDLNWARMNWRFESMMNVGFNSNFMNPREVYRFLQKFGLYTGLFGGNLEAIKFKIIKVDHDTHRTKFTKFIELDRYNVVLYDTIRMLIPENEQIFPSLLKIFAENNGGKFPVIESFMNMCPFWCLSRPLDMLQHKQSRKPFGYHSLTKDVLESIVMNDKVACTELDVRYLKSQEEISDKNAIRERLGKVIRTYRQPVFFSFVFDVSLEDSIAVAYLIPNTLMDDGCEVFYIVAVELSCDARVDEVARFVKPFMLSENNDEIKRNFVDFVISSIYAKEPGFRGELYRKLSNDNK